MDLIFRNKPYVQTCSKNSRLAPTLWFLSCPNLVLGLKSKIKSHLMEFTGSGNRERNPEGESKQME